MPTILRGDFTTYYEEIGSGEPLVLLCGIGADLQVWRRLLPELNNRFRVITVDNRGAGRSSVPDEPYSIHQMADDVVALLDHLRIPSANFVGWSMGGMIVQSLAAAHPDRVKRMVLLGSFVAPDGMMKNLISNWINVRLSNMPYEQVMRFVGRLVYSPELADNQSAYEAFIHAMVNNSYRQPVHGFVRQAQAYVDYTQPTGLADLKLPVSILVGEHDQLAPPYLSRQLAAVYPHATLRLLPGAHSGFVEYPALYAQAITDVLGEESRDEA